MYCMLLRTYKFLILVFVLAQKPLEATLNLGCSCKKEIVAVFERRNHAKKVVEAQAGDL